LYGVRRFRMGPDRDAQMRAALVTGVVLHFGRGLSGQGKRRRD